MYSLVNLQNPHHQMLQNLDGCNLMFIHWKVETNRSHPPAPRGLLLCQIDSLSFSDYIVTLKSGTKHYLPSSVSFLLPPFGFRTCTRIHTKSNCLKCFQIDSVILKGSILQSDRCGFFSISSSTTIGGSMRSTQSISPLKGSK